MLENLNRMPGDTISISRIKQELAGAESVASAAQALSYREVRAGIRAAASTAAGGGPQTVKVITEFRDNAWLVSKIGVGRVAAGRACAGGGSDGLGDLGYRDPEDVAARARACTARTGRRLPVPGEHSAPFRPGYDPPLVPVPGVSLRRGRSRLTAGAAPPGGAGPQPPPSARAGPWQPEAPHDVLSGGRPALIRNARCRLGPAGRRPAAPLADPAALRRTGLGD